MTSRASLKTHITRQSNGKTAATGAIETHPLYQATMSDFREYITRRKPFNLVVENSPDMLRVCKSTGQSYLEMFCVDLAHLGYNCKVMQLDHGVFCEMPRPRVFIIGSLSKDFCSR